MNLSKSGWLEGTLTKRFKLQGKQWDTLYRRYTYESANKIYDVDVRDSDGNKTYHVNCGFDVEPYMYHRSIEQHFSLQEDEY